MNAFRMGRKMVIQAVWALAIVSGPVVALGVSALPAEAQVLQQRRGVAVGDSGAAGRTRGHVSNGEGEGAVRRGVFAGDRQGNGAVRRGGCADGKAGSGCRGRAATWNADGSFSGQSGTEVTGDTGAFSSRRSVARDADGAVTGTRSTEASGGNGSYSGASSLENGTYNRDGTYAGTEGQSATVQGNWTAGAGGSRAVTCTDPTGAIVDCR